MSSFLAHPQGQSSSQKTNQPWVFTFLFGNDSYGIINERTRKIERAYMGKNSARVRNWLMLVAVGLLIAAICFAVFGFTHVISPVTAIGNAAGFLITSLVVGFFALRK
ncbi:hypothetical protein [Propionimicrobium lymphophilum]|uniref:hypothetical protein n=1 Tax=Propionimicrobium lymphophilum TaxID=33012 RepID=UPI001B7F7B3D|nr:hypothetical protein [Propionimicrobium lymphophilum]